jgi:hypothetical protein
MTYTITVTPSTRAAGSRRAHSRSRRAWLVVLMASIRPTVRRVTETLATPARANINTTPPQEGRLDFTRTYLKIA